MRKNIIKIYSFIFGIGIAYFIWISLTQIKVPCLFFVTTGLECPGCGLTRMFLSIAKFDFVKAFSFNPVMFMVLIFWNIVAVFCFLGRPAFVQRKRFLYVAFSITVVCMLFWGVIRNII